MIIIFPAHMADTVQQLRFEAEYRARFERRLDKDFSKSNRDNRTDFFQRARIGMKFHGDGNWTGFAQFQFAHDLITTPQRNSSDESRDILLAYARQKNKTETLTLGRQKIDIGSERLIGSLEWVNRSRSFDAIRFQTPQFDAFAAEVGIQNLQPQQARIVGISAPNRDGATTLIFKHDKAATSTDIWTLSEASKGLFHGLNYDFEGALQNGHTGGKPVEAWAVHLQTGKMLSRTSQLGLEWNAASGGSSAGTTVRTFDNLYPTNHKFYGLMDMQAWKNMSQIALIYSSKVRPDVDLKARIGKTWLQDSRDAWYGATGVPNRYSGGALSDPSGASGKDLGTEFDLESVWKKNSKESFLFGAGLYRPGHFVSHLTGSSQPQVFTCLQYSLRF